MGLLLAGGDRLKHLKEKPHRKIQYYDLSFYGDGPRSRRYGRPATLTLLVQPYDDDDDYCCCPFPSNGAPVD
jgi:hypothetical protein